MRGEPIACSTDIAAWNATSPCKEYIPQQSLPVEHMRWGLAGLKGSYTFWHLDSDGLATYVDVKNEEGEKVWVVAKADREFSGKLRFLMSDGFDLDKAPSELQLEAILLTKGTRL
jgi:hypothetical protein